MGLRLAHHERGDELCRMRWCIHSLRYERQEAVERRLRVPRQLLQSAVVRLQYRDRIFKEIFPCFSEAAQEKLQTSFPRLLRPPETPKPTFLEHQQTLYRLEKKIEKQCHLRHLKRA